MKTNHIITLSLILIVIAGCGKRFVKERTSVFEALPADGMTFRASSGGVESAKSHFQDISTSGQLVWDEDDILGVYAVDPTADDLAASAVQGVALINPEDAGHTSAEFKSVKTRADWFTGDADGNQKWFFAYYPCYDASTQQRIQRVSRTVTDTETGSETTETKYGFPVLVEGSQEYVVGFRSYQTLVSAGGVFSPSDDINLGAFTPVTALVRFKFRSKSGSACKIREIYFDYGYLSDSGTSLIEEKDFAVAGTMFMELDPSRKTITPIEIRSDYKGIWFDFVLGDGDGEGGKEINGDWSEYFYVVVLPTHRVPADKEMKFQFEAEYYYLWDDGYKGNAYQLITDVPAELSSGFEAGKCYSFAVSLEEGYLSVGYEGSVNLGAYTINTEWGEDE